MIKQHLRSHRRSAPRQPAEAPDGGPGDAAANRTHSFDSHQLSKDAVGGAAAGLVGAVQVVVSERCCSGELVRRDERPEQPGDRRQVELEAGWDGDYRQKINLSALSVSTYLGGGMDAATQADSTTSRSPSTLTVAPVSNAA